MSDIELVICTAEELHANDPVPGKKYVVQVNVKDITIFKEVTCKTFGYDRKEREYVMKTGKRGEKYRLREIYKDMEEAESFMREAINKKVDYLKKEIDRTKRQIKVVNFSLSEFDLP